MRWKFERDNFEAYRCCFCFHVRTGTLLLGLLHLVGYFVVISVFVAALVHPELVEKFVPGLLETSTEFLFGVRNSTNDTRPASFNTRDIISDNLMIGMLLTIGSLAITVCLIYGTISGRPQYITPFFCIQVFELCITGMMMLSYFSDIPDLKKWLTSRDKIPFRDEVLLMDNDHLTLIALIVFVLVLSVKMYLIGIIWACYKYLKYHEGVVRQGRMRIYDRETTLNPEDTEMLLPPKYEDVLRMPTPLQSSRPLPPVYAEP